MEFVHYDPANAEQQEQLKQVTALIKERHVPVANLDLLKPKHVVTLVASRLSLRFSVDLHTRAWRHWGVRPAAGADKPEKTKAQYCVYDSAHKRAFTSAAAARSGCCNDIDGRRDVALAVSDAQCFGFPW